MCQIHPKYRRMGVATEILLDLLKQTKSLEMRVINVDERDQALNILFHNTDSTFCPMSYFILCTDCLDSCCSCNISLPHSRISGSHLYETGIVMIDRFIIKLTSHMILLKASSQNPLQTLIYFIFKGFYRFFSTSQMTYLLSCYNICLLLVQNSSSLMTLILSMIFRNSP